MSTFPKSVFLLVWDDWRPSEGIYAFATQQEAKDMEKEWRLEIWPDGTAAYPNIRVVEFSSA